MKRYLIGLLFLVGCAEPTTKLSELMVTYGDSVKTYVQLNRKIVEVGNNVEANNVALKKKLIETEFRRDLAAITKDGQAPVDKMLLLIDRKNELADKATAAHQRWVEVTMTMGAISDSMLETTALAQAGGLHIAEATRSLQGTGTMIATGIGGILSGMFIGPAVGIGG